jgi:hypothetical protein
LVETPEEKDPVNESWDPHTKHLGQRSSSSVGSLVIALLQQDYNGETRLPLTVCSVDVIGGPGPGRSRPIVNGRGTTKMAIDISSSYTVGKTNSGVFASCYYAEASSL